MEPRDSTTPSRGASQVVAGALISGDRVLLCHRHPGREWFPNVWDLPGGHVERGEAPRDALRRELIEELGVDVDVDELTPTPSWRLVDRVHGDRLLIWRVHSWGGSVTNAAPHEHDRLGWFTGGDLADLQLADARYRSLLPRMLHGWPARDACDDDRSSAT